MRQYETMVALQLMACFYRICEMEKENNGASRSNYYLFLFAAGYCIL